MKVLGIESSADETSAAVIKDGNEILSNVIASSLDMHLMYGGIVPEIAARSHIEVILPTIKQALTEANTDWDQIDAIAATYGPGLLGSLLIGVLTARTLAIAKNKPLYAVNHVTAHVYANFLTKTSLTAYELPRKQPEFPLLALIASGGHSQLALFKDHFDYQLLGQTTDDAVGEAFDKVAKILGLPYPGGPSVARAAKDGDPTSVKLPTGRPWASKATHKSAMQGSDEQRTKPYMKYGEGAAQTLTQQRALSASGAAGSAGRQASAVRGFGPYDFSFSGLKTAVLRAAQQMVGKDYTLPSTQLPSLLTDQQKADIAASFQHTACKTLIDALEAAKEQFEPASIVIAGGVAANTELRHQAGEVFKNVTYTDIKLCTDNAAMIAAHGYYQASLGQPKADTFSLEADPSLSM